MGNTYKYGAYGELKASIVQNADTASTAPAYVGVFPVNLIRGYTRADMIGRPVLIANMNDAREKVGYADNWGTFSGCEALAAHFDNAIGNIGPIYVINVLDPSTHKKAGDTTQSVTFANGRATIKSATIILDTLLLADLVEGTDYSISYDFDNGEAVLTSLDESDPVNGAVNATFSEIDTSAITADTIIGGVSEAGSYSGLGSISLLYPAYSVVPNLILCPGWSHKPEVYKAMLAATEKINGHWYAFALADLPIDGMTQTIADAVAWKQANGYTGERSKVFWPMGADASGRLFHLSTLAAVEFMRADMAHDGVPMETCANKPVPVQKQYFGAGYAGRGFEKSAAMTLCENGITTLISWSGLVLWGDHTAAYQFGADKDPRADFDVSIRMLEHIVNGFQTRHMSDIDEPMTLGKKDEIVNAEQEVLDSYVTLGALLGDPKIQFIEAENSKSNVMAGHFCWDLQTTPTPPLKSATVGVAYTDSGFASYFEEV